MSRGARKNMSRGARKNMSRGARKNVVRDGVVAVYHAWNTATRQLFEFGPDPLTGVDYSYRREWIHRLQMNLASLFAIDIGFHSELANHYHIVVRTRPDVVERWSDDDVVRRWLTICKLKRTPADELTWPTPEEVEHEFSKPGRIPTLRKRLSKLSWFMATLGENISRRVNSEEGKQGTLWARPYHCRELVDIPAILVCGIYVDLNELWACQAATPEQSRHTSAYDRIMARHERLVREALAKQAAGEQFVDELFDGEKFIVELASGERAIGEVAVDEMAVGDRAVGEQVVGEKAVPKAAAGEQTVGEQAKENGLRAQAIPADAWMSPLSLLEAQDEDVLLGKPSASGLRCSDKGLLPITLDDYLRILDEVGRQLRSDKPGAIPADLAPILERLKIRVENCVEAVRDFAKFHRFVGRQESLDERAAGAGVRWYQGKSRCAQVFR